MNKVWALTIDGRITECRAPEEKRGQGRCNHIAHQEPNESINDFYERISDLVYEVDGEVVDQTEFVKAIVSEYGAVDQPDFVQVYKERFEKSNAFSIGTDKDVSLEEAKILEFSSVEKNDLDGRAVEIYGTFEFRGKTYKCSLGEVPTVDEIGIIEINGTKWRFLPVLEQRKAGLVSYRDNIVISQDDSNHIAMSFSKNQEIKEGEDYKVKILGSVYNMSDVSDYLSKGKSDVIPGNAQLSLDNIDPIVYKRFPKLKEGDIESLMDLPQDEIGDISWRRCIRYQDMVDNQLKYTTRRMGNTFRANLKYQQDELEKMGMTWEEAKENGTLDKLNEERPLFYQDTLTENIKKELVSRSNVQNVDDLNPIIALSQSQKISLTGPGGWNKDQAPYELRMPHKSHYELIDSMDTSSGKNVGLTMTLANAYIGKDRLIHKKPEGSSYISPSDFIPYKMHNDPNRAIMAVAHLKQATPIVGGEEPIIKTPAWDKIKGAKIGVNLVTAYIPMADNYEDAVVLSESAAAKMKTRQTKAYKFDNKYDLELKVGDKVTRKQKFGFDPIRNDGVITSIDKDRGLYYVESEFEFGSGDKLSGRYGNKSVASKIVPDSEMPLVMQDDGTSKRAEIIMSPLSVVSRKNLGQVMECNASMGGDKSFEEDGTPSINKTRTVILPNGKKIEATAGYQYTLRLNHIAEKKLSSYADELDAKRENQGSRLGEMEAILLSQNEDRLAILRYLRHQEQSDVHNKLDHLTKSIGIEIEGVNFK